MFERMSIGGRPAGSANSSTRLSLENSTRWIGEEFGFGSSLIVVARRKATTNH